jgi:hypothetical protein
MKIVSALVLASLAGTAVAQQVSPATGSMMNVPSAMGSNGFNTRSVPLVSFNVFTGLATGGGGLVLLESSTTPVRDDVVTLGNANEAINDYLAVAGSVQRFVTSTVTDNFDGTFTVSITVSGRNAAGAPADLWPSGLSSGTNALTGGGFAIGLSLPAALGGLDQLNIAPFNNVLSGNVVVVSDGVAGAPNNLPLTFFGGGTNWNGTVGVAFPNAATGTAVQSDITLNILVVPAPSALALLGLSGVVVARRRR